MIDSSQNELDKITNLAELLQYRALHQKNQTAYTFLVDGERESISLTYQELDRMARGIAAQLQLVPPGDSALLLYPPGLEFIAAFFGCLYAGVIAVPVYPPTKNYQISQLQVIITDAQATVLLTTTSILDKIKNQPTESSELVKLPYLATDNLPDPPNQELNLYSAKPETIAFLQYSPSNTARPRGAKISHDNLMHNECTIIESLWTYREKCHCQLFASLP